MSLGGLMIIATATRLIQSSRPSFNSSMRTQRCGDGALGGSHEWMNGEQPLIMKRGM